VVSLASDPKKGGVMIRRKALTLLAAFAMTVSMGMATAHAGEITGTGEDTAGPANANSICVFSGLNDDPDAPRVLDEEVAPNGPGGVSQSYGQDVTLGLEPQTFNPGDACRGGSN